MQRQRSADLQIGTSIKAFPVNLPVRRPALRGQFQEAPDLTCLSISAVRNRHAALYLCLNAFWFTHLAVEFVSLAAGGIYEPAVPPGGAGTRRRGALHDGFGQCPLAARETRQG